MLKILENLGFKLKKEKNYLRLIPYTWRLIKLRTNDNVIFDELISCINNKK